MHGGGGTDAELHSSKHFSTSRASNPRALASKLRALASEHLPRHSSKHFSTSRASKSRALASDHTCFNTALSIAAVFIGVVYLLYQYKSTNTDAAAAQIWETTPPSHLLRHCLEHRDGVHWCGAPFLHL
jgi:hypothetical protein